MLRIENLCKSFNNEPVFTNYSYNFDNNGIYRLEGPNGVGKTTLLKMIRGIVLQDSGLITLSCGTPLAECTTYIDANNRSFLHRLTVKENLAYFLALNKQPKGTAMIKSLMEEFQITHLQEKVFSLLSVGQMQLISLIRGLLEKPKLLLIDEALTNIDQQRIEKIADYLERFLNNSNRIVIICSHTSLPIKISATVDLR